MSHFDASNDAGCWDTPDVNAFSNTPVVRPDHGKGPLMAADDCDDARAYRELCEQMGKPPWNGRDMREWHRLRTIGHRDGWLVGERRSPDTEGRAWNRTNPPKRGKPASERWKSR
jgi:hypothetical protein